MGSAPRTHTAPRELQAVQEVARELAREEGEEKPGGARRRFGQREHQACLQGCAPPPPGLARRAPARWRHPPEYLAAAFDTADLPCELTIIEVTGKIIEL